MVRATIVGIAILRRLGAIVEPLMVLIASGRMAQITGSGYRFRARICSIGMTEGVPLSRLSLSNIRPHKYLLSTPDITLACGIQ